MKKDVKQPKAECFLMDETYRHESKECGMIDWTKPIETVPCGRNPEPVPCRVASGPDRNGDYYVEVAGEWLDSNGAVRRGEWCCVPSGNFLVLDGAIRNVATAEATPTPTCPMCDGTGTKDYAGFAMDPCDHKPVVTDPPKTLRDEYAMAALTGLLASKTYSNSGGGFEDFIAAKVGLIADAMMAERRKEPNA